MGDQVDPAYPDVPGQDSPFLFIFAHDVTRSLYNVSNELFA